jgi:hypothetical protein
VNAYEKSLTLGLSGSHAEQVAILRTLTVHDIAVTLVRTWLRERNLWMRISPTVMGGTIEQIAQSPATPEATKEKIRIFYAAVFGDSANWLRTTDPQYAGLASQIITELSSVIPVASDLIDSFYALDGGRPYKDLTVEQFDEQRTDYENLELNKAALETVAAAHDAAKTEYRKAESSPDSIIAAARALLGG